MKYVGIQTQQSSNNIKSMLLLICFPGLILVLVYAFAAIMSYVSNTDYYGNNVYDPAMANDMFLSALPWVFGGVGIWFCIAYFSNTAIIRSATGARTLERRENPRVYNIVENLCMSCGMNMPKINVIDDPMLNAFASGIDEKSYTVTVTTGICNCLNDEELAGVIGHELTHIRNRDTRLLIISIVFVGIMSFVLNMAVRMLSNTFFFGGRSRDSKDNKGGAIIGMLVVVVLAALGYFFTMLTRFAINRKREYMADAGGAELCGNPLALASALRKISGHPGLGNVEREDVSQLFICKPKLASGFTSMMSSLFSTHPDIEKRIAYLEQF